MVKLLTFKQPIGVRKEVSMLRFITDRIYDWIDLREANGMDILIKHFRGCTLFFPISDRAKEACAKQLGVYPKKRGAYAVPDRMWKREYDTLHHGPCPLIMWAGLGMNIIDTP